MVVSLDCHAQQKCGCSCQDYICSAAVLRRCSQFLFHLFDGRAFYKLFRYCTWMHSLPKTLFYSCGLPAAVYCAVQTKAFSIFAKAGSLAALLCVLASFLHEHLVQTRRHSDWKSACGSTSS